MTKSPSTSSQRSTARFRRAARVLPPITLDAEHDTMLRSVIVPTGEAVTDWVRRMIREQYQRVGDDPRSLMLYYNADADALADKLG